MGKQKTFGSYLKSYRRQATDPQKDAAVTQERLSELLAKQAGTITSKTLRNWERGYSHPRHSQRDVILSLTTVLKQCNGLQTIAEANQLLQSGNYAPLTPTEQSKIGFEWHISFAPTPQPHNTSRKIRRSTPKHGRYPRLPQKTQHLTFFLSSIHIHRHYKNLNKQD